MIPSDLGDPPPLPTQWLLTKVMFLLGRMLAEKLDMTPEDAERWIVNLIRNARLDAKIDSEKVTFQTYVVRCLVQAY